MAKPLKKWLKSLRYREEATVLCLALLTILSALCTISMYFFNPGKAVLLTLITIILLAALLYYRLNHNIRLRASITTLRHARATRKKRR